MLQTIETAGKGNVGDRFPGSRKQDFRMIQSYFLEILMWRNIHDAFKNTAEMKRAYQAMPR